MPGLRWTVRQGGHRHKVLGAWVPEWEVQPCRNPDCSLYEGAERRADGGRGPGRGSH